MSQYQEAVVLSEKLLYTNESLFVILVSILALSSALLLTLVLLIIFIVIYCKVKRQFEALKAKQSNSHSNMPLPPTPREQKDYTRPGAITRTHTYAKPETEEYGEIPPESETYMYPEESPPPQSVAPSHPQQSQYVDMASYDN